ncbi:MAG: EamA family transporter [Gaiella sp.]
MPGRSHQPRPTLGYAMTLLGAVLFGFGGSVAKVAITEAGLSAERYTQIRVTGAFAVLAVGLALLAPARLKVRPREIPWLVAFGLIAVALVQWLYFIGIQRLPIGVTLVIQFAGIVLVAVWARIAWKQPVRRRVWLAAGLSLLGLALVAEVWTELELDGIGLAASFGAAGAIAMYFLMGEHGTRHRDPPSLVCLAMLVAAGFWAVVQPPWSYPFDTLAQSVSLTGRLDSVSVPVWALAATTVVAGTVLPFLLSVGALRHLPASRVGVVATIEPVIASVVAWAWLGETLAAWQIVGGLVVLSGVVLAITARQGVP